MTKLNLAVAMCVLLVGATARAEKKDDRNPTSGNVIKDSSGVTFINSETVNGENTTTTTTKCEKGKCTTTTTTKKKK